ncbi:PilX N-terminal domain-containing pilus assembly protein [Alishewanella jeotgali]|uniref:Tfp pilus assembly protein PilX-like protein n=1 Tax=Alishewanella jeotgali KCTC 22429 TaxID=1129374 RepID=H3ZDF6_9ALTE|nr:PilX N-terminal domain-containing pilus assembly protein [Alishewanella jeotgali]EHR41330.1 Tfp pilus assembly protein PilX-like protein [Alishewanella jeotgali KCTC 22429]
MKLKEQNFKRSQSGMAMVISLVLLLALTLMVTGSMRGSLFQEKMTANQFNQSRALMAAEAGAAEVWNWLVLQEESGQMNWADATWQSSLQTNFNTAIAVAASKGRFTVEQIDWSNPSKVSITVLGEAIDASPEPYAVASTKVNVEFLRPITAGGSPASAFMAGLLSEGNITVNGGPSINGNIHSNKNVTVNGNFSLGSTGNAFSISASGTAKGKNVNLGQGSKIESAVAKIQIPSATDFINANKNSANVVQLNDCTNLPADLQGKTYFCNNNVVIENVISNGTIMTLNTIDIRGGVNMGNNKLSVALIAAGNITNRGSNESAAVFWTDGAFEQNGSARLKGAVVAKEELDINGKYSYTQVSDFEDNLDGVVGAKSPQKLRIARWIEQR